MVSHLAKDQKLSIKRSCQLVNLSRAAYYREENKFAVRDAPVVEALNAVVAKHGRWGFWKCHARLRLEGHPWNHKRVWRVYCQMKLNLPRRVKRRLTRPAQPLNAPLLPNEIWRKHGISSATYYKWKSKYGGLDVSELVRVKELEAENSQLKRMYANLALENEAIKAVLKKL